MLRFFLDKFKESPGPMREARQIIVDVVEELLDIATFYMRGGADERGALTKGVSHDPVSNSHSISPSAAPPDLPEESPISDTPKKPSKKSVPKLRLEVPSEFASALLIPENRKKQTFKVLAILWDAERRGLGNLSAKQVSDHGESLGLAIRHENVRKVIRMKLGNYVDMMQIRQQGSSIYHYRITKNGMGYFEDKYLKNLFSDR